MKTKKQISVKLFAFIMALLMLLVSLPVSAIASAISTSSNEDTSTNVNADNETVKKDVIVLEEDETLRDENIKHFKLSDGTTKAVVYSQAVHYKDADGKWVDIDNALTLNGSEYSSNNKSEIKFANKSGSNGLVSIKDGDYKIDFTPLNTNKVSVVIENPQGNNSRKFEDISVLNNLVSKAIYADIYDGIDIEYILVGNNIKENIIVKEKQDSYTFSFELELNKLRAELVDGAIILSDYDSGEQVYEIPVPYMFDANNVYSDSVEYSLVQNNKWKYTFTVTADAEWINADDRAFPVTIDPSLGKYISLNKVISSDAEFSKTYEYLVVGENYKSYINLATPYLPNSAYITESTLSLKYLSGYDDYVGLYEIESSWNSSLTWENMTESGRGTFADVPISYNYITRNEDGTYGDDGWYTWNITDLVRAWNNGTKTNYGVGLGLLSGSGESKFSSINNDDSTTHPMYVVSYRDMKGLESYWTYVSQDAGLAGNGNINVATGNLIFNIETLTTTDGLFGYTPTMIYNSALAGLEYKYGNAQIGYWGAYAANGFKVNFHEALIKDYYTNAAGDYEIYYIWADADGTEHYFIKSAVEGEDNIYYDEDGLQLKLTVNDNDITQDCIMTDSEHNERVFAHMTGTVSTSLEGTWYLKTIRDRNGNELYFQIDGSKKPNDVKVIPNESTSSPITMISPLYNSSSCVTLMWCLATRQAVLFRHSTEPTGDLSASGGRYLREVLYIQCDSNNSWPQLIDFIADTDNNTEGITVNAIMQYEYDEDGYLISAHNTLTDYKIKYTYTNGKVTQVTEYGEDNKEGQTIGISYYSGYTEVRSSGNDDKYNNEDDIISVYCFDNLGRVVTNYYTNVSRTEVYGIESGEYEDEVENAKNSIKNTSSIIGSSANYIYNGNLEKSDSGENTGWTTSENATFTYYAGSLPRWDDGELWFMFGDEENAEAYQTVYLTEGEYTLSADFYAYASDQTQFFLAVANSEENFLNFEHFATSDYKSAGTKNHASLTFNVDKTDNYVVGVVGVYSGTPGDFVIGMVDNIMLAKGGDVQKYNYVYNADFEKGAFSYSPNYGAWSCGNALCDYEEVLNSGFGNSLVIDGIFDQPVTSGQIIYTANESDIVAYENNKQCGVTLAPTVFNVSGYGKASSVMDNKNSQFRLLVQIGIYDDEKGEPVIYNYPLNFRRDSQSWQYVSDSIYIPEGTLITYIAIYCEYSYNVGKAYFDNISFVKDEVGTSTKYDYYANGKLKYKASGDNFVYYVYNDDGNVKYEVTNNSIVEYKYYDSDVNLIKSQTYYEHNDEFNYQEEYFDIMLTIEDEKEKVTTAYTYDKYGLLLTSTVSNSDSSEKNITTYTYKTDDEESKIFGLVESVTDSLGNITKYFYNEKSGKLIAKIGNGGIGESYTYDELGHITQIQYVKYNETTESMSASIGKSSQWFYYDELGRLYRIYSNGNNYTFSYDPFGNKESISIAGQEILSQTTNENNGKITEVIYSNGTTVNYEYDHLERIIKIVYQNGDEIAEYEYKYDSNGNVIKVVDSYNSKTTLYRYDSLGRLETSIEYDNTTFVASNSSVYYYDVNSRISKVVHYYSRGNSDDEISYIYQYDGKNIEKIEIVDDGSTTYELSMLYDDFDRLSNKKLSIESKNITLDENYIYQENGSFLIYSYESKVKNGTSTIDTEKFIYTYDETNNIREIKDGSGNVISRYTYDDAGRLERDDNNRLGYTFVYKYDVNGNIVKETKYEYTLVDDLSNVTEKSIITYTYNNSSKIGKLASYDGKTITYDVIGNPLNYNDASFTWINGNFLNTVTKNGITTQYTYNSSGIRVSKIVGNVEHDYILDGEKILAEKYGNITLTFLYDENNSPIGFVRNASSTTETYLFTKNGQGDIIGVYTSSGTLVAEYKYDAWGKQTVIHHTSERIGSINPFRYRGYYYDAETKYYYVDGRYYDPETKRFINSESYIDMNDSMPYCNNNPVKYSYTQASATTISTGASITYNTVNKQASRNIVTNEQVEGIHWKNDFMVTDWPTILSVTGSGIEFVSWDLSAYKGSLYFDGTESQSIYIAVGNISAFAGFDVSDGIGFDLSANVAEIGYDGKVIDASVEFLTIGITYMYKNGTIELGMGYGWVGFSISVNVIEFVKVFNGG